MYKTIEEAIPMIRTMERLTKTVIDPSTIQLETLGTEFTKVWRSSDYRVKRRAGIKLHLSSGVDPSDFIGKWAFFPDIAMQTNPETAFGKIMGARATGTWAGTRFFLANNLSRSMHDIMNSSPYIISINEPSHMVFCESEQIICSEYLNAHCIYLKDGVEKSGRIVSFNPLEIHIESENGDHDTVLFENRESEIIQLSDDVGSLTFSMIIRHSK